MNRCLHWEKHRFGMAFYLDDCSVCETIEPVSNNECHRSLQYINNRNSWTKYLLVLSDLNEFWNHRNHTWTYYFPERLCELQLFEQHVTSSQHLSHFFLHENGRPQTTHIFSGKLDLLGFFSLFPPSPPFLPKRCHDKLSRDNDGSHDCFARGSESDIRDDFLPTRGEGEMKKSEHRMAQQPVESAQNDRISLLISGMIRSGWI